MVALVGLVVVPLIAFAFGPLGRYVEDHPWVLALTVPLMLWFALVHTHVNVDGQFVVIRRRWLWLSWSTKRFEAGGTFDEPIQDSAKGQLFYAGRSASSDGFAVARAADIRSWLNTQLGRLQRLR